VKVKSVIPTEAGIYNLLFFWIPTGVYPCESRGGNDTCAYFSGFPLEFTPAKAGVGMTIATWNDNCNLE